MRVLITAGGTREPIDNVRYIGNSSSGRTGMHLARYFANQGWRVTVLRAVGAVAVASVGSEPLNKKVFETKVLENEFVTVNDLQVLLEECLSRERYDLLIHAAAVSDFRVESIYQNNELVSVAKKIESSAAVTLNLVPTPKLLPNLRAISLNPKIKVVGFKLTLEADAEPAVEALFAQGGVDFIVHNVLRDVVANSYAAKIYAKGYTEMAAVRSREELAANLESLALEEKILN